MIAVIFEVMPAPGRKQDYLALAEQLRPELEKFDGVSTGKYTIGLGQTKMSFCDDREGQYIFFSVLELHLSASVTPVAVSGSTAIYACQGLTRRGYPAMQTSTR